MSQPPPPSSMSPPAVPESYPDHIDLTILSPSSEVINGGRMNYPHISLDTTISQLKDRIQSDLPARPPPQQQRLIYRGHALVVGQATLRQILRGSQSQHSLEQPSSYTLHLVLPPTAPTNPAPGTVLSTTTAIPLVQQDGQRQQNNLGQQRVHAPATVNPLPGVVHDPQNTLQQLNQVQQQLTGINHVPNAMQIAYQMVPPHMQQLIGDIPTDPGHHPQQFPAAFFPGAPNGAYLQGILARQQMIRAQAGMHAMHNQNPIQNQPHVAGSPQLPQPSNPTEMPTTRVQESIGPNGERVRTTITEMNFQQTMLPAPASMNSTAHTPETLSNTPSAHAHLPVQTGMTRSSSAGNVPSLLNSTRSTHRHLPHPFAAQQAPPPTPTAQTTAWLLSSSSGPQALLFAPGHGYFASPSTQTSARLATTRSARQRPPTRPAQTEASTALVQQQQANPNSAAAGNAAGAAPNPVQIQADPRRPQAHDPNAQLNNLIQRAWLFVRLYMFTFILSDSGTWRRYLLLALALFACLLPRDNPFNDLFTAVRRHIDNLVGPPPPPQPTAQPGAVTTPEETAARLLRERQARSPFRAALFRVERAVALFVASLVPGVGERHVRAREEVRRLVTEEQERIAREERERIARDGEHRPVQQA